MNHAEFAGALFLQRHLSMYIDAIDWVSLPNVLGMSQHADGGLLATKPYRAWGAYIQRMSDYCRDCRSEPKRATGDDTAGRSHNSSGAE